MQELDMIVTRGPLMWKCSFCGTKDSEAIVRR